MLPRFNELPIHEGVGLRHAWEVLDHDLGTVSLLTPKHVVEAAQLVRDGEVFSLNLPMNFFDPPLFGREPLRHDVFSVDRNHVDERLDAFYPQASSQWDGLRHVRAREYGFFGGTTEEPAASPGALGIEHWARRGIVGRGILLDLERHRRAVGQPLEPLGGEAITADELQQVVERQQVTVQQGDILCIRTGWIAAYRALDADGRRALAERLGVSGLRADEEMSGWLWDQHVAALCLDNPTVEVAPGDAAVGSLHRRLLPMLGFALSELLDLDDLAAVSTADGRWDFMFVAAPMHLEGGVGSPANAVAIR
jgi:kynurenine formamidase